MVKFTLFFMTLVTLLPATAQANKALNFKPSQMRKEQQIIDFAYKINNKDIEIAKIDLNDDFIDEYVLRPQNDVNCTPQAPCSFTVIALQDFDPVIIGQFDAHKILVSGKKTYGIRDIILYNDPNNDFKMVTAKWNPFAFQFQVQ